MKRGREQEGALLGNRKDALHGFGCKCDLELLLHVFTDETETVYILGFSRGKFDTRSDVKIWIVKNQFGRRNLSAYDRSILVLKLEEFFREKANNNIKFGLNKPLQKSANPIIESDKLKSEPIDTKKELAKIAGVSHDTIAKVKFRRCGACGKELPKRELSSTERLWMILLKAYEKRC